jgi:S-adenosylmethionine-diacylgycerolhomoserine-N-methlytransferase
MAASRQDHRAFLNRYYGVTRHLYDATRKYYLLGRDAAIARMLETPWERLIEIGPGTGRNLRKLRARRPSAHYGGVEACDVMLTHARERLPWAQLVHGYAEDADYTTLLGARPDIVLFSYCLSMVQDAQHALANARRSLAPGGRVIVVDFGDLATMPTILGRGLRGWLDSFHVQPLAPDVLAPHQPSLSFGPGRYFVIASLPALPGDSHGA